MAMLPSLMKLKMQPSPPVSPSLTPHPPAQPQAQPLAQRCESAESAPVLPEVSSSPRPFPRRFSSSKSLSPHGSASELTPRPPGERRGSIRRFFKFGGTNSPSVSRVAATQDSDSPRGESCREDDSSSFHRRSEGETAQTEGAVRPAGRFAARFRRISLPGDLGFRKPEPEKSILKSRTQRLSLADISQEGDRISDLGESLTTYEDNAEEDDYTSDLPWSLNVEYPVIPGRLSFAVHKDERMMIEAMRRNPHLHFITSDAEEQYVPIYNEAGPVCIGVVHSFNSFLQNKLAQSPDSHVVYCCGNPVGMRTNAAFLIAAYLVLKMGMTPEQALSPFRRIKPFPFIDFKDSSKKPSEFQLSMQDCLSGLEKAAQLQYYTPAFDSRTYEWLNHPMNGFTSLLFDKIVAFRSPMSRRHMDRLTPEKYIKLFQGAGVKCIVRLNHPDSYSSGVFTEAGFEHHDIYIPEDQPTKIPTPAQLEEFLNICDRVEGKVAVCCDSGLGRTGIMVACFLMRKKGFTAAEAIAWLRLVRPGSVYENASFLTSLDGALWDQNRVRYRRASSCASSVTSHPDSRRTSIASVDSSEKYAVTVIRSSDTLSRRTSRSSSNSGLEDIQSTDEIISGNNTGFDAILGLGQPCETFPLHHTPSMIAKLQ